MPLKLPSPRGPRPRLAGDFIDMLLEIFSSVFDTLFGGLARRIGPLGCTSLVFLLLAGGGVVWYLTQQ